MHGDAIAVEQLPDSFDCMYFCRDAFSGFMCALKTGRSYWFRNSSHPFFLQLSLSLPFFYAVLGERRGPNLVSPHICIGGREDSRDAARLKDLGVTHVLNCATQLHSAHRKDFVHEKLDIMGELTCEHTQYSYAGLPVEVRYTGVARLHRKDSICWRAGPYAVLFGMCIRTTICIVFSTRHFSLCRL